MTQANHIFSVQTRSILGKKVKNLRADGLVIGSVSVPGKDSLHIQASYRDLSKLLSEVAESSLFYLQVDGNKQTIPVLIDDIQLDPISQEMKHITFRKVSLNETVKSEIKIEFIGEVNANSGSLVTVRDTVEIEALPTDLPEKFEVDLSVITEIGQSITLADLKFDTEKISLVVGNQDPAEMPIVIYQAQEEEESVDESDEVAEPEITVGSGESKEKEADAEADKE
jgi:large subunit ribosomal protein L25